MRKSLDNLLTLIRGLSSYIILALLKTYKYTLFKSGFGLRRCPKGLTKNGNFHIHP
jgi:hypothetical protein